MEEDGIVVMEENIHFSEWDVTVWICFKTPQLTKQESSWIHYAIITQWNTRQSQKKKKNHKEDLYEVIWSDIQDTIS